MSLESTSLRGDRIAPPPLQEYSENSINKHLRKKNDFKIVFNLILHVELLENIFNVVKHILKYKKISKA